MVPKRPSTKSSIGTAKQQKIVHEPGQSSSKLSFRRTTRSQTARMSLDPRLKAHHSSSMAKRSSSNSELHKNHCAPGYNVKMIGKSIPVQNYPKSARKKLIQ